MDTIWAPWRMEYIEADKERGGTEKCIFCSAFEQGEKEETLVAHIGKTAAVMLNRYPYNNGHVLVMPLRHIGKIEEINDEETLELLSLTQKSLQALHAAMKPDGYNLGLNLSKAAGAGVEDHLHLHIVPRWEGDTSFMPVLADTKVMPEHLLRTYRKLRDAFSEITGKK